MPSKDKHLLQYKKNKTLSNSKLLKDKQYKDWRIVTLFYAGLHILDSTYAEKFHPSSHKVRKSFLEGNPEYSDIIDDYENLEMLSRKSRYNCVNIKDSEVTDALVNLKVIEDFCK